MEGLRLLYRNNKLYHRDCSRCLKYLYNEKTGEEEEEAPDEPYLRHKGCPPPCQTKKGCEKGTPENQNVLTEANLQAFLHYRECEASLYFPNDSIVKRNASLFHKVLEEFK